MTSPAPSPPRSPAGPALLLAGDVGGTSTRLALAAPDGTLLAVARGGPGNPNALGHPAAADELAAVFGRCLRAARATDADALRVRGVLGMAGASALTDVDGFLARALPGVAPGSVRVLPDLAVAFSSASAERRGYVLLAGTGAGAVQVADGALVERRDGWGWLLGDAGSAFWLGREAVRATLDVLERGDAPGPLAAAVLAATGSRDVSSLLAAVYRRPPVELAGLAPQISAAASADPVAASIAARGADRLLASWHALDPRPGLPVVLTGSVLVRPGPVGDRVRAALGGVGAANPVHVAGDGLAGALWLAVGDGTPAGTGPPPLDHTRLVAQDFTDTCG
ncbi:N-acetylglucosamine kinase-like BadF-type ATPase [Friedmanniella endophytica]|uniref:N-acetylglucosamine kinase-like BadF-type ATPase n=1 Tax=Microlunatus kandeliicorticis TaxID=1759536 RepID=A0A7W3IUT6_9ACTN|nr:BadF/BadG/BcrA/BcrD ATPase family protein [Microlunatus kandeliicorticis]MBA8795575.1 N-acetylglucosamine kinase-like BadF-type ATPase [Microlunatus kandeliicorticis]